MKKLKELAKDATTAMEQADEILNKQMNEGQKQIEADKQLQRQSNAVLRVLQALELLNHEL